MPSYPPCETELFKITGYEPFLRLHHRIHSTKSIVALTIHGNFGKAHFPQIAFSTSGDLWNTVPRFWSPLTQKVVPIVDSIRVHARQLMVLGLVAFKAGSSRGMRNKKCRVTPKACVCRSKAPQGSHLRL